MKNNKHAYIFKSIGYGLYVAAGILIIFFAFILNKEEPFLYGAIPLFIAAGAHILGYFLIHFFTNKKSISIVNGLVFVVLGIFYITQFRDIKSLCIAWAFTDAIFALIEILENSFEVKEDKLKLGEIAISIGEIVFAIILLIKLEHGLKGHIIYLGASLVVLGILMCVGYFLDLKKEEKE